MVQTELLKRMRRIVGVLELQYPDTSPPLIFNTPFQLLIAVLLSAQTTDRQVNQVTRELFQRFPDVQSMANADISEVETSIRSVGFFHVKAQNVIATANVLKDKFNCSIPSTMDELLLLPGIGRKSAGVVLATIFQKPAIIVDTHFGRLIRRLGFSNQTDPEKLEFDLANWLPPEMWSTVSMLLNFHGREVCTARYPSCCRCRIQTMCPFLEKEKACD
jgi:endonuclease-3